jgi:uncharacterized protein (TIGR03663 family)
MSTFARWLTFASLVVLAGWLRMHDLARRPMHADEANQAVKLGELIEAGSYAFDPRDHHGPTLYYAAVPLAWFRGERTLAELSETTVRLVPAIFGTISVVLLYLIARPLGAWPALAAAAFLAVSPPSVYYSRYFIQETLLVTFTLATLLCAARAWRTLQLRWAVLFGVTAGLMQATKASAPLFLAAALLAFFAAGGHRADRTGASLDSPRHSLPRALGFALAAFLLTAVVFYTSFFTHVAGLRDALAAYGHAVTRFGAEAAPTGHEKPFGYYFALFGWFRTGGLVWHQVAFAALTAAGLVVAIVRFRRDRFLVFAAVFASVLALTFSTFAYKTPWHVVHFIPGFALLAAGAIAAIARLKTGRPVACAFAFITVATLFQQTQRVAFLRPADQRNPYAYVHSAADVLKYRAIADAAVTAVPHQPVRVVSEEYWPLPWYLRGIPQVGYYAAPPEDCDGALVIASTGQADAVRAKLTRRYRETFLGLRPGVLLVLFIAEP